MIYTEQVIDASGYPILRNIFIVQLWIWARNREFYTKDKIDVRGFSDMLNICIIITNYNKPKQNINISGWFTAFKTDAISWSNKVLFSAVTSRNQNQSRKIKTKRFWDLPFLTWTFSRATDSMRPIMVISLCTSLAGKWKGWGCLNMNSKGNYDGFLVLNSAFSSVENLTIVVSLELGRNRVRLNWTGCFEPTAA